MSGSLIVSLSENLQRFSPLVGSGIANEAATRTSISIIVRRAPMSCLLLPVPPKVPLRDYGVYMIGSLVGSVLGCAFKVSYASRSLQ